MMLRPGEDLSRSSGGAHHHLLLSESPSTGAEHVRSTPKKETRVSYVALLQGTTNLGPERAIDRAVVTGTYERIS